MALRYDTRNLHGLGGRSEELQTVMDLIETDVAAKVAKTTVPTALTITATTGTLPTADGSITVADAATPTVAELLEAIVELNAKVEALRTALR